MSFSQEWDDTHGAGTHQSRWPCSALASLVYRLAKANGPETRVLELGVGASGLFIGVD